MIEKIVINNFKFLINFRFKAKASNNKISEFKQYVSCSYLKSNIDWIIMKPRIQIIRDTFSFLFVFLKLKKNKNIDDQINIE